LVRQSRDQRRVDRGLDCRAAAGGVPPQRPTLIVAVDLLPLAQPIPTTLGEMAGRMQDLMFAAQSRRTLARWSAAYRSHHDERTMVKRCQRRCRINRPWLTTPPRRQWERAADPQRHRRIELGFSGAA
jgi:hypothetical protein